MTEPSNSVQPRPPASFRGQAAPDNHSDGITNTPTYLQMHFFYTLVQVQYIQNMYRTYICTIFNKI